MNQPYKKIIFIANLIIPLMMSGCVSINDSNGSLEKGHMPISQYIREEFTYDSKLSKILRKLPGVKKQQTTVEDYNMEGDPLPDGSYVYFAPYSADAIQFLTKPSKKLAGYCRSQGGVFTVLSLYKKPFFTGTEVNPINAYFSERAKMEVLGDSIVVGSPFNSGVNIPITESAKDRLAENAYNNAVEFNRITDVVGAKQGYLEAVNAGAFGYFSCVNAYKKPLWNVSIIPIAFERADHEHLKSEALYLGIRPGNFSANF